MQELRLPGFEFKRRISEHGEEIWDEFRRKYVQLTAEEWVRQHFLKYLNIHLGYPKSLLKTEFEIRYNRMKKRPDIVAYDNQGQAILVVECKAPGVKISNETFQQVSVYNQVLKARFMIVTNGMDHFCCEQNLKTGTFLFVEKIPVYPC